MRHHLIVLSTMLCCALPASAQVSFSVGFQVANIGVSLSTYPNLVRVPGYPVYYASGVDSNYFFYDGLYWVFDSDRWYSSTWYNGPWMTVDPAYIPVYLLRVPVRYYRHPPPYFVGWQQNRPPRWNDHWGHEWAERRSGWDRWNRQSAPAPAPLPTYQRNYAGERYPSVEQQAALHDRNYQRQPRDPLVRQQLRAAPDNRSERNLHGNGQEPDRRNGDFRQAAPPAPAPAAREPVPADRQVPHQPRMRERPDQQPMDYPRSEDRRVPRGAPPAPREARPQDEGVRHRMAPSQEERPMTSRAEPGQRHGQQGQPEKREDRGPDRGR